MTATTAQTRFARTCRNGTKIKLDPYPRWPFSFEVFVENGTSKHLFSTFHVTFRSAIRQWAWRNWQEDKWLSECSAAYRSRCAALSWLCRHPSREIVTESELTDAIRKELGSSHPVRIPPWLPKDESESGWYNPFA